MEIDRYTSNIKAYYAAYLEGLISDYLAIVSAGRTHDGVTILRNSALQAQAQLIAHAIVLSDEYVAKHEHGAPAARELRSTFIAELRHIATKNLNDLIVKLASGQVRPADLFNRDAGAVGLLFQRKMSKPQLTARDRAGRAWATDKLVATLARQFAMNVYLEDAIARFEDQGIEFATVVYPDSTHPQHGLVLRVAEVDLVRGSIFHPNSHAQLVPHVPTE